MGVEFEFTVQAVPYVQGSGVGYRVHGRGAGNRQKVTRLNKKIGDMQYTRLMTCSTPDTEHICQVSGVWVAWVLIE